MKCAVDLQDSCNIGIDEILGGEQSTVQTSNEIFQRGLDQGRECDIFDSLSLVLEDMIDALDILEVEVYGGMSFARAEAVNANSAVTVERYMMVRPGMSVQPHFTNHTCDNSLTADGTVGRRAREERCPLYITLSTASTDICRMYRQSRGFDGADIVW